MASSSRISIGRRILLVACLSGVLTGTLAQAQLIEDQTPLSVPPVTPTADPSSGPMLLSAPDSSNIYAAADNSLTGLNGPVPLDALIAYARVNNPEISAARFHAQRLAARVPQAQALPDPKLMTNVFLQQIQTAAGPQEVALSLSQQFPWFGKQNLRARSASQDAQAAYARVVSAELSVIERVKTAYYELYFIEAAIAENERWRKPLEDVIALARTQYETGATRGGLERVLQAQTELAKLKTDLVQLEESRRASQARLAGALHLPPRTAILPVGTIARTQVEKTVETLVALAESNQPALESYRHQIARDRSRINLAERAYWPDVTVSANWYGMSDGGISPVSNGEDAFAVGVGLNLPIYRSRLDGQLREAKHQMCATNQEYAAARDRFQTEVQTLYARFREHHRTLTILEKEIVPRAEQTLTLMLESYRLGRADFQQLVDVYRSLVKYRIDMHRRTTLREQAVAALEKTVGCAITSTE